MRRLIPAGLVLALVMALLFAVGASSEPITGVRVPTVGQFNELDARQTAGEVNDAAQDAAIADLTARVAALEAPAPEPTPTPTPEPTPEPTPDPEPVDFPDATNTGVPAGTTLTTVNGNVTLSTAGQVYADRQVNGCITVNAADITIRRVRVVCQESVAIWNESTGLVVEDTEIDCGSDGYGRTGLAWRNYTARRVNAHGCENIMWAQENVLVVNSYLHDPVPYDPARDPHTDSIQIPSGAVDIVLRHNRIYGGYNGPSNFGSSAVTMGGNVSGIVVDDNVLAGGGYTLYCEQEDHGGDGSPQPQYTNNRFSTIYVGTVGGFGPVYDCADDQPTGNVYHETGEPITLN